MMVDRATYDLLVRHCSVWMENNWNEFDREWSLRGCRVESSEDRLNDLYDLIKYVRNFA